MMDEFVGKLLAFKGEDEYISETSVLLEITEVTGGNVEIAFDAPLPGKPRIYLTLSLPELVAQALGDKK